MSRDDERTIKTISFTNEYKEELRKLNNEKNSSKLICKLLREYYKRLGDDYTMEDLEKDMTHIKEILEKILKSLGGNS